MPNRSAYMAALEAVVINPSLPLTIASLASVTPHLTDGERIDVIDMVNSGSRVHIATPALSVRNSVFILSLNPGFEVPADSLNNDPFPPHITVVKAVRCPSVEAVRHFPFASRALVYSQEHWPERLKPETWASTHRHIITDSMLRALGLEVPAGASDFVEVGYIASKSRESITSGGDADLDPSVTVNESILAILDTQIERIEHGATNLVVWETEQLPARIQAHLRSSFAKAA